MINIDAMEGDGDADIIRSDAEAVMNIDVNICSGAKQEKMSVKLQ